MAQHVGELEDPAADGFEFLAAGSDLPEGGAVSVGRLLDG
jgi:hypothetical protein